MYGNPTFDPNLFAVHSYTAVNRNYEKLVNSPGDPLINYSTSVAKAPGSTFKVIDSSAIYDQEPRLAQQTWSPVRSIVLPQTNGLTLQNFGGEYCPTSGTDLAAILLQSCDTSFALIGKELGAEKLYNEAVAFGFNRTPPLDLPKARPGVPGEVAKSNFPPGGTSWATHPG